MSSSAEHLVGEDGCRISRRIFADQEIYDREQEHIFQRNWLYLCHESQLQKPGDFMSAFMGETPVILARGEDGNIHASVNSCVHRGLPVCRHETGNTRRFVCPYHGWSYAVTGELVAVPQDRGVQHKAPKSRLRLYRVPRVESYEGLVFGNLDEGAVSLEEYLGDMRFYLDAFLKRFPGGLEIGGATQKWMLNANWKLPMENQLGDVGHSLYLHSALLGASPAIKEVEKRALTMTPEPGHAASVMYFPADAPPETCAWGMENVDTRETAGSMDPEHAGVDAELREYLLEVQRGVAENLSPGQARIKGLTYGVYPNLALIIAHSTLRVCHPRGPGQVEYWCWWLVPREAPESLRRKLRQNYIFFFGPGGALEQEDSEAWAQQHFGSSLASMRDQPYFYGMGAGEEYPHPELPGHAGTCYNEHFARNFYLRWRDDMSRERPGNGRGQSAAAPVKMIG